MEVFKKIIILSLFFLLIFSFLNFKFNLNLFSTFNNRIVLAKSPEDLINELNQPLNDECGLIGKKCCSKNYLKITPPSLPVPLNLVSEIVTFIVNNTIGKVAALFTDFIYSIFGVNLQTYCRDGIPSSNDINNCICGGQSKFLSNFCNNITNESEKRECVDCIKSGNYVWTAIGCIGGDFSSFIEEKVFGIGVGLAGVISLFCIIYAAFQLQTSQGSAEKIKKAQELLTSCIMGLMLIIFSVFILKLIGVDILKIPGFSK